jgi:glycosyltransferase involved in cell wall biosynthesis
MNIKSNELKNHSILLIHPGKSSFVRKDIEILKKYFTVKDFFYQPSRQIFPNIIAQSKLLIWLLFNIGKAKAVYIWFADYHSFLPIFFSRLFGKKTILILGGYDVANIPELKYGSFYKPLRAFCAAYSIRNSGYVIAVDRNLIDKAKTLVKDIRGTMLVIPTGYNSEFWRRYHNKEKFVLNVGIIDKPERLKIKGIDFLLEVAKFLPDYQFVIIGLSNPDSTFITSMPNVRYLPKLSQDLLKEYYSRAKVYVQFSITEGFPNVVCEAMLCECIPVGIEVGGIPTAIGDCGFLLEERDPEIAAQLIKKALEAPAELGEKARQRIISLFSEEKRETQLLSILKS